MKFHSIHSGFFKLDGGAMFGVVPKSIWKKLNPPDDNNLCTWALRCLLVEHENRKILIDTGMGNKQSEKFFSYYEPHGEFTLENSLKEKGLLPEDITDVFLTHLHFDHCGGAIKYNEQKELVPAFPNATYWSNQKHWEWATDPNAREKASFLKENILPIQESAKLKFIDTTDEIELFPGFKIYFVFGHTEAMMIPHIEYKGRTIVYLADLLPSVGHIPLPYVMACDTRPLITLKEKNEFLKRAVDNNYILFFEHDKANECCTLKRSEDNKIVVDQTFNLSNI